MKRAESYLKKLRRIDILIREGRERIHAMELSLLPSGISYDKIQVQTSPGDMMSEGMARICDEIAKLEKRIAKDLEEKREIDELVSRLDPVQMEIIYYRFRDELTFSEISQKVRYSYSQTRRLYRRAIKRVEVMIDEKYMEKERFRDTGSASGAGDDSNGIADHGES